MATKKKPAPAKENKKEIPVKPGKKQLTPEERKAKAAARKERLAALPEEQRQNCKQIDVIPTENGEVKVFAMPVRKIGCLVTAVAVDSDGNVISTSTTLVEGVRPRVKKGHGNLTFGAPGLGKKGKRADNSDEDSDEGDDDED